jgi:hypothetical protein
MAAGPPGHGPRRVLAFPPSRPPAGSTSPPFHGDAQQRPPVEAARVSRRRSGARLGKGRRSGREETLEDL